MQCKENYVYTQCALYAVDMLQSYLMIQDKDILVTKMFPRMPLQSESVKAGIKAGILVG